MKTIQKTITELSLEDIKEALLKTYSPDGGAVSFILKDTSESGDRYPTYGLAGARIVLEK